jgi:dTMP kinase
MSAATPYAGLFITLEGPDGSGKSTQAARLADALASRGARVTRTREPGGTAVGERIRAVVLTYRDASHAAVTDALLFSAARAQLVEEVIRPALAGGAVVVCDRYADSTLAYQGYGGGVDIDALRELQRLATGGLQPDLTLLLDLPVDAGLARRAHGPDAEVTRFEAGVAFDRAFHERVRAGYLQLAAREPARWQVVDADRDPDVVAADLVERAGSVVAAWMTGPLADAGKNGAGAPGGPSEPSAPGTRING